MLSSLTIQNIVLIDHLNINFQAGLCTLTGETGAGKSILLDALGLAIGARAEARLVRSGQEQASVTAIFDLPPTHPAFTYLESQDIIIDEPEIILRRTLKSDGRSKAFLNDQPISIHMLGIIGAMLVEIHGQHDTQGLLDPATHRTHLDDFAQIHNDLNILKSHWTQWQDALSALQAAIQRAETARTEEDYLRTALEDLDLLNPQDAEEAELSALRGRLMARESILEGLNTAYHALNGEHDPLAIAARALERIADKCGDDIAAPIDALDRANAEMQEALSLIQSLSSDLSESDYNLSEIDDRLFALKAQARKHNCAVDDLPEKRKELAAALNMLEEGDDLISHLTKTAENTKKAYTEKAMEISAARHAAARSLDTGVAIELPPLKMERAKFVTHVAPLKEQDWNETGMDHVRFLVATNPGADAGPLHKIASGGEMSRFMLALKVVMAARSTTPTMVFDEVDSGIGGATADAVGERLSRLGRDIQVLVVTHSPQVAARGNYHWIIHKSGNDNMVTTSMTALEHIDTRREEIARMLSGAEITSEARKAAEKLLSIRIGGG